LIAVKQILAEQGRTQKWLARRAEYTEEYVSRVLNGHVPLTHELMLRFSEILELPVSVLFPRALDVPTGTINNPNGSADQERVA